MKGDVTWGHHHDLIDVGEIDRDIAEGSGTGDVQGTGSAEKLYLKSGEDWEFEDWFIGADEACVDINKYLGDAVYNDFRVWSKTHETKAGLSGAGYTELTGGDNDFTSLGWAKIKVEKK